MKKKVLFLCTHNSARSQMAEGLLRKLNGDYYEVFSAGTEPATVNPYVMRVMAEVGIDLSAHRSKHLSEFSGQEMDFVVTVCDNAQANCPYFPGGVVVHHSFSDPSQFHGSDEEIMAGVRVVRDAIKKWIIEYFGNGRPY